LPIRNRIEKETLLYHIIRQAGRNKCKEIFFQSMAMLSQ